MLYSATASGVTEAALVVRTTERLGARGAVPRRVAASPRIAYIAYPSSLVLRSANAVQTYATVRELRALAPRFQVLIPRFAFRESRFVELGAIHLLRLPFNAGRHVIRSVIWSYAERTWFSLRVLGWLARKRLVGAAPDVLYVRDVVCAAWLAAFAPRVSGTAVVFEAHDLESGNRSANTGPVARCFARWLDRIALGSASGVVSLTETFLPQIERLRGTRRMQSVTVIPDAYDDAVYIPRDRGAARCMVGLPADAFVVVYTGLTFAYHGVDLLVDAFTLLTDHVPDARLLLVGGRNTERETILRQVHKRGIDANVALVPPRPTADVPAYLAAADALVIPDTVTKASASPLKLFEYAAMERPIVASDLPALREVVPEDGARYVAPADAIALAEGMRWVAEHPRDADAMARRARHAVSGYTYRARAAAIVAFCAAAAGACT